MIRSLKGLLAPMSAAAALAVMAPMTAAGAAELAVVTVTAFDPLECAFRTRSGAVFYEQTESGEECGIVAAVGDRLLVNFDPVNGRNEVLSIVRFQANEAIGEVLAVDERQLTLTTGAVFNIADLEEANLEPGDFVRITFTRTLAGENSATRIEEVPEENYVP